MNIKKYFNNKKDDENVTLREIAYQIGISYNALYKVMYGLRMPHVSTCQKIEKATKGEVTVKDIIEYCLDKMSKKNICDTTKSQEKQCISAK